jgi:hypothetical protein
MSNFVVSTKYGELVVEPSIILGIKHASVRCSKDGKTIGIPAEYGFSARKQFENFLRKQGWVLQRKKGWLCPNCNEEHKKKKRFPIGRYKGALR